MSETKLIAVQRTLKLMELLSQQPEGMSFSEIENQLDISAASLTRLVRMLMNERWLEMSASRKYVAGQRIQNMMRGLSGRWTEGELAAPLVRQLAFATGQSACFAVQANYGFTLLTKSEMASSFHFMSTNTVNGDIVSNGIGLMILAHLDEETQTEILRRKAREAQRPHLINLLEEIKVQSVYTFEEKNVTRLVAPVFNLYDSSLIGVVSLAILGDFKPKNTSDMSRELMKTAARISAQLTPNDQETFEILQVKQTA